MYWNLIRKSSGFVPFGANLTHFGAKHTIPGFNWVNIFIWVCTSLSDLGLNRVRLVPNWTNPVSQNVLKCNLKSEANLTYFGPKSVIPDPYITSTCEMYVNNKNEMRCFIFLWWMQINKELLYFPSWSRCYPIYHPKYFEIFTDTTSLSCYLMTFKFCLIYLASHCVCFE